MSNFFPPKTFAHLLCERDQAVMPHSAGRVVAQRGEELDILVKCRQCGVESIYTSYQLPPGFRAYAVRITGEDGPHLPAELRPVPFLEEELTVVASSEQDAHERAAFATTLRPTGQLVRYYLDGTEHLDERF